MKIATLLFLVLIQINNIKAQELTKTGKTTDTEAVKYDVSFGLDQLVYHRYRVTENTKVKRVFDDSTLTEFEKVVTHWFTVFVPGSKDEGGFLVVEISTDSLDYKFNSKSKKSIEAFSVVFDGEDNNANMYFGWGKTIVSVPVKG